MKEIFFYIGISGFLAVFQAAACGIGLLGYWHWRDPWKDERPKAKEFAGLAAALIFIGFFAIAPIIIAFEFGGWLAAVFQSVVLIVTFAFVRMSRATGDRPAPAAPDPEADTQPTVPNPRRHLARAIPGSLLCFYLAIAYAAEISGQSFPGMDKDWLADLMRIEMPVIHSLPFISLITLIRFQHRHWRYFQWFLFVTWYCLYLGFTLQVREIIDALVAFAAATLGTYLSFMLQQSTENRVVLVFKRWGINLALYALISAAVGAGNWRYDDAMLKLGLIYFALIGSIELTPVYRTHWGRWLQQKLHGKGA